MNAAKPIDILLVEDSPTDAELTIEALRQARVSNRVHHVEDGEDAVAFLNGEVDDQGVELPDLILLDLNMPRKNGFEVLRDIRGSQRLRRIPVIILTTSSDEADVISAYELAANCYITKPVSLPDFVKAMQAFEAFWLAYVTLPPKSA